MLRVLQIGMTDNLGGIETFLINYYRNIDRTKIQFDFINIYQNKLCFQDEIEDLGGNVYKVPNYYKHPFKYMKELKKIIKESNYKIIHCNMNSAVMLYPLIAAKLAKAKIIISHSHNASSDKGLIKKVLHNINRNLIPLFANTYFACSNKAGKWFFKNKILSSKNYYVINNGVDINKYCYKENIRKEKRKELNINDDLILIGHVGRFSVQKNHKFLIEIFYELYKFNNKVRLMLIGIGPLMESVKEQVKKMNLTGVVYFLNQRNDLEELYQAMDLFLLPSLYEGLPLVGVEAQASGLKCAFSSNITEEIKILDTSIFIDLNNSSKEWAHKIQNLLNTSNSRNVKINDFDINNNAKKLEKIYLSTLE